MSAPTLIIDDTVPRAVYAELAAAGALALPAGGRLVYLPDAEARDTADTDWLPRYCGPHAALLLLDCRDHRAPYLLELCRDLELGLFVFSVPNQRLRLRRLAAWIAREWPTIVHIAAAHTGPYGYQFHRSAPTGRPHGLLPG